MSKVRIGWRQQRRIKASLELQQDQQDCGVAALAAVLRYYGCVVDKELLRRQCGINEVGTTLFGLYQAAEQQGLHVEGVQMGMQELLQLEQLAILHVLLSTGQGHYLVYYGQDKKNKLVLFDPSIGLLRLSVLELDKLWKHKAALLFEVGANVVLAHTHQKAQKRLLYSFLEKDSPYLVISCFLGIGLALLNLSTAVFSHKLIDDLLPALALQRIHLLLVLLTLLLFIHVLLNYIRSFFVLQQSKRFNERITLYFFEKLLHLPKLFFDHRKVGDMIARLTDTQRIQKNVNFIANSTCIDLLVVIMSLVFLIFYSWPIALMITAAMPMYIYIVAIFSKKVVAGQARVMVSYSHTESNYMDCIKGIVFIIERGLENLFLQRTAHYFSDFQAKAYALGMTTARYALCVDLCNVILTIALITMGAHFVIHGSLSIGQLMAILTVSATIFPAFQRLAQLNLYIQEIKVSLNRMYDLVTAHRGAGIAQAGASRTLDRGFENLVLKNIGFGFQAEEVLFQDLNFELRRGEMFVLFGNSGHGKSTLLQLLLGHYMPLEGTISVNGLPLSSIAMPAYRAMIASVAQEITLFNDSLYFNVTMNTQQDEASVSMFQSFWVGHGFHVYFSQLPVGYASLLGEEGYKLSGGQKQLLALARALYSKPTLLLLDEPTAAMDEEMEQFVVGLLIKLKPRMGILFITHRQYIGLYADRCYLLRAGELHEVQAPRPQ